MSQPASTGPPGAPPRRPRPGFEPRFTLLLMYLALFFALYCLLFALPALLDVLGSTPPGPEQEALAAEITREALRGKLGITFLLALGTVAAGAYYQVLPGVRAS